MSKAVFIRSLYRLMKGIFSRLNAIVNLLFTICVRHHSLESSECFPDEGTFVLVHIGRRKIPHYIVDTIGQIRLYNDGKIILACSRKSIKRSAEIIMAIPSVEIICFDNLPISKNHLLFLKKNTMSGFSRVTTERFFVLEEVISYYQLHKCIHIENDVLVYFDVKKMIEKIGSNFEGLLLTRHSSKQCIGGIVLIEDSNAIKKYTTYLSQCCAKRNINDMDSLSEYAYLYEKRYLPVIPPNYVEENELISTEGNGLLTCDSPLNYCDGIEVFGGIFDAAALGQYIGGIDKIHTKEDTRGYINPNCVYNASRFEYSWEEDKGLKSPYLCYQGKKYKILNLHIHSKELFKYISH